MNKASELGDDYMSRKFLDCLIEQKYDIAETLLDSKMKAAIAGGKLKLIWAQLIAQLGPLSKSAKSKTVEMPDGSNKVTFVCEFEKAKKDLQISVNAEGQVSGFFVLDSVAVAPDPGYADRSKFKEIACKVGSDKYPLDAVLSLPEGEGPFPALVLVHGSGAHEKDETVGAVKVFRDIAWGLASRGIAVLRYNKRNFQYAEQLAPIASELTVKEEVIDDALLALQTLNGREKIDSSSIYVLGHSLGGIAMPRIAEKERNAAGYIIMAGNTRPLEDLILEQTEYISSLQTDPAARKRIETLLSELKVQAVRVKSTELSKSTKASELPLGIAAAYWLDSKAHDPMKETSFIKKPVLVLQGESDYQVTMKDLAGWKQALSGNSSAGFKSYPGLGHLFTPMSEKPTPADYDRPANVSVRVIDDIADWIKNKKR